MTDKYFPTVCGLWCDDCNHFEEDCQGCSDAGGCVFWTDFVDTETCPVYICCVEKKGLPHCGYCDEMPCERYARFRDPDQTDEEIKINLKKQNEELIRRRKETESG
ncbi:MAG: hypothetical protein CVV33_10585 [Methanomicrobiales archaeon HGW-Methanomicrobiales-4]|nr:MAG: hypothetical protein CVV33_10585 [Methanomicrobiales archaeon HGW-Methanomicrobiales-4]